MTEEQVRKIVRDEMGKIQKEQEMSWDSLVECMNRIMKGNPKAIEYALKKELR